MLTDLLGYGGITKEVVTSYTANIESFFPEQTWETALLFSVCYIVGVFALNIGGLRYGNIKGLMAVYNLTMSGWSFYMFYMYFTTVWSNWEAADWDMSLLLRDPELKLGQGIQATTLMFLWSKYIEYADTLWMILLGRLKMSPRCFLQVYHHFVTPLIVWSACYTPFTCNWLGPLTNTFVHVIMYFYYGVSHFIKSKSFRKLGNYIFFIQMTQFFTCMVNGIVVTYADSMSSRFWFFYLVGQYFIFFGLFIVFYMQRQKELKSKTK